MNKHVVMVSSMGDMWLETSTANKLARAMQNNTAKFVTLNGNMIAINSIRGLLTPEAYKAMASTRKQNWVCRWGSVHQPSDNCQCQPQLPNLETKALKEHEPTEDEKLRGRAVLEYMRENKRDLKAMTNKTKREEFVKQWITQYKNNGKTIDKQ